MEGLRHDLTLYSRPEIKKQLKSTSVCKNIQYCIYSDSGYNQRPYLHVQFQGSHLNEDQSAFNDAMSDGRIKVDWIFKKLIVYWITFEFRRKLRVIQAPIGSLYFAAILLTNIRTFLYGNQIATNFQCAPPWLS